MDYMAKINELTAQKNELIQKAEGLIDKGQLGEELADAQNQIKDLAAKIARVTDLAAASAANAKPIPEPENGRKGEKPSPLHVFDSLGDQLKAIENFARRGQMDERLERLNNEAKGANTGVGAEGGFAIQEDFAKGILETAAEHGEILSRVRKYTVGANANSVRWYAIDEDDVSSHVFGGVQVYWAEEGGTVNAAKPKLRQVKCDLEKMMGLAYATSEMLEDTTFMTSFFGHTFSVAVERLLEEAILSGTGTGQPKGILTSTALLEHQRAEENKIGITDVLGLWQLAHHKYRRNMVWLAHPDCEEQLQQLTLGDKPIWMPEGGISEAPYQRILGRPVLYTDCCAKLGEKGDLQLDDLSKYTLITKGGARQAWSMHVEFLTDQMAYRIVLRCNGTPELTQAVTIRNSESKRSAFVALGAAGA